MRRIIRPEDRNDPYPHLDDGDYPPDPECEVDAADYACKPADWGEAKAVMICSAKRKPRWWQWRKRRQWFKPVVFDVTEPGPGDGSITITPDGMFTITF